MQKILLPVDGSRSTERAVEYIVATKAAERCREIQLLNVQPPVVANSVILFPTVGMMINARRTAGEEILRPVQTTLSAHGIDHIAQVVFGEVAEAIMRYALERGCSSIVMGTRGMRAIGNLLLGSVAAKVMSRGSVPVTLVKR